MPSTQAPETQATADPAMPRWQRRALDAFALLLLAMMTLIVLQVLSGVLGLNELMRFDKPVFLLGSSLNQNTILDLQWFLLAVIGLVPAALVWLQDRHVRVDFVWQRLTLPSRHRIELIGHVLFTAPFLAMSLPAAWRFTQRSFVSAESTSHGGLTDLFVVKATLPIGLGLLAVVLLADTWRLLRGMRQPSGPAR
jgi:TRAP-type mannitol/chloroaromatic compound transport system permease small subunit